MKSILGVCLALVMMARLAVCLKGGRRAREGEFPFLVRIVRSDYTWCLGTIVDPVRIIFPDDCLRKSPLIGFSSADVIPLVNQNPPKKYTGWFVLTDYSEYYTELDLIVMRLEPPGLELAESNLQNVSLPARALISHQQRPGPSDVVVVGLNGRVGAMTILDDLECFNRIGTLYFPMNDRLQSTKLLLGEKLMCAVLKNTTGDVGDVPPGQACERDLGAPVIQNGAVVGMLVRCFCTKYYPHVALLLRLDHSNEPLKRLLLNIAIPEPSPSSTPPNDQVSKRVKRQPIVVKNETEILVKSIVESEIQCHESSCEAPATDVTATEKVPINPSESEPKEKLPRNETIPEPSPSPIPPNDQVSKRVKRHSQVLKNETEILEKSTAGSVIQCHESSCEAPATDVTATEKVPVNPSESEPKEKLPRNETLPELSPSPLAPNNQISERVKRHSQVVEIETEILKKSIAGSGIQCHESSCEAPATDVTATEKVPVNPSNGSAVIAPMPRDIRDANASQKSLQIDSMERKEPLLNSSEAKSSVASEMHRVQLSNASLIDAVRDVSNKTFSSTIGLYRTEVDKRHKRELKEVFIPIQEESLIEKLVRDRNSQRKYIMSSNTIEPNGTEVAKIRKRVLKEVSKPIQEDNLIEKLVSNRNIKRKYIRSFNTIGPNRTQVAKSELRNKARQERHRRQAKPPAAATNATGPGGNLTSNVSTSLNGTGNANVTKPSGIRSNATGIMKNATSSAAGNITGPARNATGNAKGNVTRNASAPLVPVTGNGTALNGTVNGNKTVELTPIVPGGMDTTGDKSEDEENDTDEDTEGSGPSKVSPNKESGETTPSGDYNETGEVILSGGDYGLGLERFGGSGNDTGGSGDVGVLSGFGESAQDEIHASEEKLGPAKKPPKRPTHEKPPPPLPTLKKESQEPTIEDHENEPEPVGPPLPNDDRPDFETKPDNPHARRTGFSPKSTPFKFSFLVTICYIISHI